MVDSGSTATLVSKKLFQSISKEKRPQLIPMRDKVRGANGGDIEVLGIADLPLELGGVCFFQTAIVCGILPDGILGQDFMLKFASRIDYRKMLIETSVNTIPCYVGGESEAVSNVVLQQTVKIPPWSCHNVTVDITKADVLSDTGILQHSSSLLKSKEVCLIEGIVETDGHQAVVQIVNIGESEATLFSGTPVGTCEAYYEVEAAGTVNCAMTSNDLTDQQPSMLLPEHLKDLWLRSKANLNDDESEILADLLNRYQHVFAKSSDDLGRCDRVLHKINTGAATPCRQPPRRQPIGKRDIEKQEVLKMLERKVIEPSSSAWSSPIVLVTKKDGSTRFCVDYRRLNDRTVKDAYPIPRVDECLDSLTGSKWFSCLDLNSGFWQIGLDPADKEKTAFATSLGLYQFTVMPFGLANAPSTFERLIEGVMRGYQWEICLIYMDDVIVPSATFEESIIRLELVFRRLSEANLKLKPSKCILFQHSVKFLGHIVSEEGVSTDPDKIKAVKEWPTPRTAKHVRSFLGLCSYYRRFVKDFAQIARPLHKLCEKGSTFSWSKDAEDSFQSLKESLTTAPVLAYPQLGQQFVLDTDASEHSVGGVLSQVHDDQERVIAYMSKAMNVHERAYCVTRKELLAVIVALKNFHTYLYGQKVLLRTDNAAVSWMQSLKRPTGQVARWLQELGTYDLTVVHRPGKKHVNADGLSRMPCKACTRQQEPLNTSHEESNDRADDTEFVEDTDQTEELQIAAVTRQQDQNSVVQGPVLLDGWNPTDIRLNQMEDGDIGPILVLVEEKKPRPEWCAIAGESSVFKTLWRNWDRLEVHNGILYRRWCHEDTSDILQLIVPKSKRADVMDMYHLIPSAAHLDAKRTMERIKTGFYWPGMKVHIAEFCRLCDACAARKPSPKQNKAPMGHISSGAPMEKVCLDILGPLPLTQQKNRYILVITDIFTKWTEAIALPDQEACSITKAFVDTFVSRWGTPLQVHSDQGCNFEAKIFQEMCTYLRIEKTRTTSLRPQANGSVERFNKTLINMLSMYCQSDQTKWDQYLQQVMMAYRSSVNSSTGKTPNLMVLGREVVLPMQAVVGKPSSDEVDNVDVDGYVSKLQANMVKAHDVARANLGKAAAYRKRYYDTHSRRAQMRYLEAGQLVWLHDPSRKRGVCHKLQNKWKGPYLVTRKLDDLIYLVKKSPSQPIKAYHLDRLLPYRGKNIPQWVVKMKLKRDSEGSGKTGSGG